MYVALWCHLRAHGHHRCAHRQLQQLVSLWKSSCAVPEWLHHFVLFIFGAMQSGSGDWLSLFPPCGVSRPFLTRPLGHWLLLCDHSCSQKSLCTTFLMSRFRCVQFSSDPCLVNRDCVHLSLCTNMPTCIRDFSKFLSVSHSDNCSVPLVSGCTVFFARYFAGQSVSSIADILPTAPMSECEVTSLAS